MRRAGADLIGPLVAALVAHHELVVAVLENVVALTELAICETFFRCLHLARAAYTRIHLILCEFVVLIAYLAVCPVIFRVRRRRADAQYVQVTVLSFLIHFEDAGLVGACEGVCRTALPHAVHFVDAGLVRADVDIGVHGVGVCEEGRHLVLGVHKSTFVSRDFVFNLPGNPRYRYHQ